jgi:5'-3' exonuclease
MGVPGFFLWLWKKYKKTDFVFSKSSIKDNKHMYDKVNSIDEFLLDLNCAIHPMCFKILAEHPELTDLDSLENKMMTQVVDYIDELVGYVNPKKVVYLAIDGVAPIAKIKQQRTRRFKSVHDKELFNKIKNKHGKDIGNYWNNSAITPGTIFMEKLKVKIMNYCKKMSKERNIKFIFSTSNTPSEGEHKLLQYIRNKQISGDPDNNKYAIYGLDADLIFLALSTNKSDIFLVREAVHLNNDGNNFDILNFVSIDIMKSCIYSKMCKIIMKKNELKIKMNKEDTDLLDDNSNEDSINSSYKMVDSDYVIDKKRIIDDFIFICYLLGNDFLPHIPSLDISKNGMDILLDTYAETWNNFIDYAVNATLTDFQINQPFLHMLLTNLALKEEDILYKNNKKKKYRRRCPSSDPYDIEMFKIDNLQFRIKDPIKLGLGKSEEWRSRYYKHHFNTDKNIEEYSKNLCKHYFRGLMWVSKYYFNKCQSWDWHYPFDHAPFISDMAKNSSDYDFNSEHFELGEPLRPFMQLLSVLPPQSSYLLPSSLKKIMLNNKSSIAQLYPIDFEQDMLYKNKYWQSVPLLPSLEIEEVKRMYHKYKNKLSKDEIKRNRVLENYEY